MDANHARIFIAAEIRAEMARQRKTIEGAARVLGRSKQAVSRKWRGDVDFQPGELWVLAEWMGVPVGQFLPPGYLVLVGPNGTPLGAAS
jgi:transcriptional regulator with XRE-family HTH domain